MAMVGWAATLPHNCHYLTVFTYSRKRPHVLSSPPHHGELSSNSSRHSADPARVPSLTRRRPPTTRPAFAAAHLPSRKALTTPLSAAIKSSASRNAGCMKRSEPPSELARAHAFSITAESGIRTSPITRSHSSRIVPNAAKLRVASPRLRHRLARVGLAQPQQRVAHHARPFDERPDRRYRRSPAGDVDVHAAP